MKIIEISILIFILIQLLYSILKKGITINVYWVAYYVFCAFFVLPELIIAIYGELNITSHGYQYIRNDMAVDFIYLLFVIVFSDILRRWALRKDIIFREKVFNGINSIDIPRPIIFLCMVITFFPTFFAIFAPIPSLYFESFAAFNRTDIYNITTEAFEYHNGTMLIVLSLSMVAVVALWFVLSDSKSLKNRLIGKSYLLFITVQILLFSSKRTLGGLLIIVLVMIDILKKDKTPWFSIMVGVSFVIGYFVLYQSIVKKTVGGGASGFMEMYVIYFSRVLDMKLVIYSLLHPDTIRILDYPLQSFIYDFLFYIPRNVWPDKPYPYGDYYMAAWNQQLLENVRSRNTVSWFSEAVANMSWVGFPMGLWMYKKMLDLFSNYKNVFVRFFSIYVALYFMITHVASNWTNFILLFILYFLLENKSRSKCRIRSVT